jgi:hypothetical protein
MYKSPDLRGRRGQEKGTFKILRKWKSWTRKGDIQDFEEMEILNVPFSPSAPENLLIQYRNEP